MSDPRFLQDGFSKQLAHLVEECGETMEAMGKLIAAAGKTQRWGPLARNPLLNEGMGGETNLKWLCREMKDVREAMDRLEKTIDMDYGAGR